MPQSTDRFLVISGDGHVGPPLPGFADYFDPNEREAFDRYWRARPGAKLAEAASRGDREPRSGLRPSGIAAARAPP